MRAASVRACSVKSERVTKTPASPVSGPSRISVPPNARTSSTPTSQEGPALALNDRASATFGQAEVDVAVGSVTSPELLDLPAIPSEQFSDQPLELLAVEEAEVGRPLDEVTAMRRSNLNRQPDEHDNARKHRSGHVRSNQPGD